ncbi:MAG: phosphotransferase [Steroidobacteraceae bacterium]
MPHRQRQISREIPLAGGRTTSGVVRLGDTILRPLKPTSAFVHQLLTHLESRGFIGAPRFLGLDASNREILSFVPGCVPRDLGRFSDLQISTAARLLRDLHDATTDCLLRGGSEVICHGDASPCNCAFIDGLPAAFIDFDAAHAGSRREDIGYAAWLWIDIGNADLDAAAQGLRLADFFAAYGATNINDAVPAIVDAQNRLALRSEAPSGARDWAQKCLEWTERHRASLVAACFSRPCGSLLS